MCPLVCNSVMMLDRPMGGFLMPLHSPLHQQRYPATYIMFLIWWISTEMFSTSWSTFIWSGMTCQVTLLCNFECPLDYILSMQWLLKDSRLLAEDFSGCTSHTYGQKHTHTHSLSASLSRWRFSSQACLSNIQVCIRVLPPTDTQRDRGCETETALHWKNTKSNF